MVHYIDKDALMAWAKKTYLYENASMIRKVCYKQLLEHLNTIEVKEVDLEKEIKDYIHALPHAKTGVPNGWRLSWHEDKVMEIAKHFYELGLSVNNPITASDRGIAEEIILALNTLGEEKMISYDKEIEWLNKLKEL